MPAPTIEPASAVFAALFPAPLAAGSAPVSNEVVVNLPAGFAPAVAWNSYAQGVASSAGGLKMHVITVGTSGFVTIRNSGTGLPAKNDAITLIATYPL